MSYKKIEETFWTDPKVKRLKLLHKFLFIYLFSSPHAHYSGIYYLPISLIREETGLGEHLIRMGLTSLTEGMFVVYDDTNQVVWVKNMAKHQIASGHEKNLVIGINKYLKTLHNSPLIKDFCQAYKYLGVSHPNGMPIPSPPHGGGMPVSVTVTVTEEEKEKKEKKEKEKKERCSFKKPSTGEIKTYCQERKNSIDPQTFYDFYESKGWRVGNTPMKDWQAAVRTWEKRQPEKKPLPGYMRPFQRPIEEKPAFVPPAGTSREYRRRIANSKGGKIDFLQVAKEMEERVR